jgi:hypothetical protein
MRKTATNKKLKKFEQFEPEAQVEVAIDTVRLQKLINMVSPLLGEISNIISGEESRVVSIEYLNRIDSAIETLDELKNMFK